MSMIPEVKCRRCGEVYSSMRSRCPNCGTRRVTQSGRTPATTASTVKGTASYERAETNTKWQMIFGLILVVAVILAVIVMVSTSLNGADGPSNNSKVTPPAATEDVMPSIDLAPTPSPTPTPTVERVDLYYYTVKLGDENKKTGHSPMLKLSDPNMLSMVVTPSTYPIGLATPEDYHWSVSDDTVVKLTPNDDGTCLVEIVAAKAGGVRLYCEVFGVTGECLIYLGE